MQKVLTLLIAFIIISLQVSAQTCSGVTNLPLCNATFDDGSGSANYSDNLNCVYIIQPAGATSITLTFSSFNIESGYDYLTIHDGPSSAAPLIGSYTGTSLPPVINSTGGALWLHFESDNSYTFSGWTASYTCVGGGGGLCSGVTTITSCSTTTVSDGSGANNYLDNMYCEWIFNPPGASQAQLHFTSFDTESGYDGVLVYDGTDNTGTLLLSWSGAAIPADVVSTTGALYMVFVSDNINTAGGFSATYSCFTAQCSGTTNITSCNGTLTDGSGNQNYQNNLVCSWKIEPPGANWVTLHFNSFNTYNFDDYLEVFDGPNSSANSLGVFYGNSIPSDIVSSGGSIFLRFTTDGASGAAGWSISYTCNNSAPGCSGQTSLTNCNGTFADGSGTSNYLNNLNCSWWIHPPGATSITLHFNSFNTESSDMVTVYDGSTTAAPSLGAYSGSFAPADIVSSGGNMLVTFTSNTSIGSTGFDCSYTCQTNVGIGEQGGPRSFHVFPNPNDGTFRIALEFAAPTSARLSLRNSLGSIVQSWPAETITNLYSQKVLGTDLEKGIYTLVVETEAGSFHRQVAIIR